MQLICNECGATIEAEDVNLQTQLAKCRDCDAVFSFADRLNDPDTTTNQKQDQRRPIEQVPLPAKFEVAETGSGLMIQWRWWHWSTIFLIFFCVIWDGFLVFWYSMALIGNSPGPGSGAGMAFLLFPLLHVAVGVGLSYFALASIVNHTTILVNINELSVQHSPLPWPGNKRLDPALIDQLHCKEKLHRNKNSTWYTYEVHADMADGKHLKLVSGLKESRQARYLEQCLEKWLGITDRRVEGEYRG